MASTALDFALLALALGGPAAVLATPRAVAVLVVWFAGACTLAWLRPVREHDANAIEREHRAGFIALFVLPLVTPAVSAAGRRFGVLPWFASEWADGIGVALVALGLAVRIAAMARLGSRFSPLVAVQRTHALERGGPYAAVRHPGYLGSLLACVGAMLAFGSALALPLVAAFALLLRARIALEESLLERTFGDEWRRYRERTHALLPRWR